MNKLTESQIEILTEYYARSFDAWETWGDIYDALKKQGNNKKYPIYTAMHKHMGTILDNKPNKFICKTNNKKSYKLFNELLESFYIKVLDRKKITGTLNSKYNDKIHLKFIAYR